MRRRHSPKLRNITTNKYIQISYMLRRKQSAEVGERAEVNLHFLVREGHSEYRALTMN